jgi:hypothetical protein
VAGTAYDIDVKLQGFTEQIETPKTSHMALSGRVETVLQRAVKIYNIVLIWPNSSNADIEEFLFSVAAGETFSFDPYGTVASADAPVDVVCTNTGYNIGRMTHGSTPWRSVSLTVRPVV